MKLITLNTWGGRAGHSNLLNFIRNNENLTDVFCLQEIWNIKDDAGRDVLYKLLNSIVGGTVLSGIMDDLYVQLENILPNHQGFFRPHYKTHYGLAMFVRKRMRILEEGDIFVFKNQDYEPEGDVGNHARNIQYVTFEIESSPITVINFHGAWIKGSNKTDTEDRINQSKKIVEFIKTLSNDFILCGDFNLLPDTESLAILEKVGLRNLIKEYGITSTRTSFYEKPEKYADYILVSQGVKVKDFKVLPEEVSDHSALFLEI